MFVEIGKVYEEFRFCCFSCIVLIVTYGIVFGLYVYGGGD